MKLRVRDDSLRLRLSVPEVARVGRGLTVASATRFPGGAALVYRLVPCTRSDGIQARLCGAAIEVRVPAAMARRWACDAAAISLRATRPFDGGGSLALLIEKDFACISPTADEDQSDLYRHPNAVD